MTKRKWEVRGREIEREEKKPSGHPEAFCVIHPPEFVQDLSGVSALQFPFPSGQNPETIFSTMVILVPNDQFFFFFLFNLPVEFSNPFL